VLVLVVSATTAHDPGVLKAGGLIRVIPLTSVAALDIAPADLVWRSGYDSLHPRVDRPWSFAFTTSASSPQFISPENDCAVAPVYRRRVAGLDSLGHGLGPAILEVVEGVPDVDLAVLRLVEELDFAGHHQLPGF
jgi:hypothetical protein